jgi:hypothetical protein
MDVVVTIPSCTVLRCPFRSFNSYTLHLNCLSFKYGRLGEVVFVTAGGFLDALDHIAEFHPTCMDPRVVNGDNFIVQFLSVLTAKTGLSYLVIRSMLVDVIKSMVQCGAVIYTTWPLHHWPQFGNFFEAGSPYFHEFGFSAVARAIKVGRDAHDMALATNQAGQWDIQIMCDIDKRIRNDPEKSVLFKKWVGIHFETLSLVMLSGMK